MRSSTLFEIDFFFKKISLSPLNVKFVLLNILVTLIATATHSQMQKSVIGTSPYCCWHLMNLCKKTEVTYLREIKKAQLIQAPFP